LCPRTVDPVAAIGQHVAHPLFGRQQFALLVDDDAGQRFDSVILPSSGCISPVSIRISSGLARAVGADDADAVAALDAQREVADDLAVAESFLVTFCARSRSWSSLVG
jgi:hypothetical protein